jgi:hypothetical protein
MELPVRVRGFLPTPRRKGGHRLAWIRVLTSLAALAMPVALAAESAVRRATVVPESTLVSPLLEASLSGSPTASAEGNPPAPAPAQGQLLARPSAEELKVRELLRLTGSVNVGLQMVDKILDTFRRVMPQVPAELWGDFRAECDPRELEDAIVPLYLASFSAGELDQMLTFYRSPVGEKLLRKQPEIFRASSEAGRQWAAEVTYRLRDRLSEKGYPPPGAPGAGGPAAPVTPAAPGAPPR